MKKIILILIICMLPIFSFAEDLMISKKDYIALIIGNYVHGFKEFETSIVGFEDSASIGIYYDMHTQSKDRKTRDRSIITAWSTTLEKLRNSGQSVCDKKQNTEINTHANHKKIC